MLTSNNLYIPTVESLLKAPGVATKRSTSLNVGLSIICLVFPENN